MNRLSSVAVFLALLSPVVIAPAFSEPVRKEKPPVNSESKVPLERAIFAAGCFWKVQHVLSKVPGVVATAAGYSGGSVANPNYKQVCTDKTGHAEVVQVEFDPSKVTYKKLLQVFFDNHDPTTLNRQGPDFGTQYRSAIFWTTPAQKEDALAYKNQLEKEHKFPGPILTLVEPAKPFYKAEEYHQDYFVKHGVSCE